MNLSYWEYKTWFSHIDFTIVGSGIVGLTAALHLRDRFPDAKILVLEKGVLPQGASTKNAGFACFGSISEVLADLEHHSEEEVAQLVRMRWEGIQLLQKTLGNKALDFQNNGGHEVFFQEQESLYHLCLENLDSVNDLLKPVFGEDAFRKVSNSFGFKKVLDSYITNEFEGQLDTGKMMESLLRLAVSKRIKVLNALTVREFKETANGIEVFTDHFEFKTGKLLIATNGFSQTLLDEDVQPARAQVLITQPIPDLHIKGVFHLDQGYYYFRNIGNRILLGGGRHLDFNAEETSVFGQTPLVQKRLEKILKETILPNTPFEIDQRWSGIMGMGKKKHPIIRQISDCVFCGIRLGGMGIAIGSIIGKELAAIADT